MVMPEYVYRAVTDKGQIVRNKVEESSKQSLVKKLKGNGLTPIQIIQTSYRSKRQKRQKKNVKGTQEVLKMLDTNSIINRTPKRKPTAVESLNLMLAATEKITQRDLVIFTQNFYLLKKADFNNIHALQTVVTTTENPKLRSIIEDIYIVNRLFHLQFFYLHILDIHIFDLFYLELTFAIHAHIFLTTILFYLT